MLKNLRKLRLDCGLSQQQLAEKIGMSQQSINKYENHFVEPDIATLKKIADIFDTSIDYLVDNSDVKSKQLSLNSHELTNDELTLIENFRKLNKNRKYLIVELINEII